jgi:hypothetical protein
MNPNDTTSQLSEVQVAIDRLLDDDLDLIDAVVDSITDEEVAARLRQLLGTAGYDVDLPAERQSPPPIVLDELYDYPPASLDGLHPRFSLAGELHGHPETPAALLHAASGETNGFKIVEDTARITTTMESGTKVIVFDTKPSTERLTEAGPVRADVVGLAHVLRRVLPPKHTDIQPADTAENHENSCRTGQASKRRNLRRRPQTPDRATCSQPVRPRNPSRKGVTPGFEPRPASPRRSDRRILTLALASIVLITVTIISWLHIAGRSANDTPQATLNSRLIDFDYMAADFAIDVTITGQIWKPSQTYWLTVANQPNDGSIYVDARYLQSGRFTTTVTVPRPPDQFTLTTKSVDHHAWIVAFSLIRTDTEAQAVPLEQALDQATTTIRPPDVTVVDCTAGDVRNWGTSLNQRATRSSG